MNKALMRIYAHAPIFIQDLMISAYGWRLKKQRYGAHYWAQVDQIVKMPDLSLAEARKIQNEKFLEFLHYTVAHSKFYQRFYKDVNLDEIKSVDDIHKLPILDKETLRENIDDVYTLTPAEGGIMGQTGGTTGKSLQVIFTPEDIQYRLAVLDAWKTRYGFVMGKEKSARFNGKDIVPLGQKKKIFWRNNFSVKQRIYSSFYLSSENIPYYIADLNKFKPVEIDGFITSIYEVAKYMKDHGIKPTFKPRVIFPTSETVLPIHRQVCEEVFGCPVRDQYASSEGAPFITECSAGHMHEDILTGVFEHVPTEKGTKLIITSFHTHGTPLIRYDIGDNIVESSDADAVCACGCSYPIVEAIDGRKADYLYSEERGKINLGNLSNVIKNIPNCIKNIQFVQETIDHITIRIVVDEALYKPKYDKDILHEMIIRFGEKMTFSIEKVTDIPREKSGKYRIIKSSL